MALRKVAWQTGPALGLRRHPCRRRRGRNRAQKRPAQASDFSMPVTQFRGAGGANRPRFSARRGRIIPRVSARFPRRQQGQAGLIAGKPIATPPAPAQLWSPWQDQPEILQMGAHRFRLEEGKARPGGRPLVPRRRAGGSRATVPKLAFRRSRRPSQSGCVDFAAIRPRVSAAGRRRSVPTHRRGGRFSSSATGFAPASAQRRISLRPPSGCREDGVSR